jgi:DNA polymerase-3 subunit epsilon
VVPSGNTLASPLSAVTFVVLDLETTGGSPTLDRITEIGALKLRDGELLGRIETLVNPGVSIPPTITLLTGITEAMVMPAPRIGELLPTILEFLGDAVIVGHNIRFDCGFLDAALVAHGYPPLANCRVDTIGMARRLVRDDVPNLRLHTLAQHFRTETEPAHRAYADAAATAELFHTLLEHAATWGVLGLDDLVALPKIRVHSSTAKLALTARMPRVPGVYLFRDRRGTVLFVGKATNLRARVRAYFSGEDRRQVPQLLRETARIEHHECAGPLEAAVRELRLIEDHRPRFNRPTRARRRDVYLKLTRDRRPRLSVVRVLRAGDVALGPFSSGRAAQLAREAVERAVPEIAVGCDVDAAARCAAAARVEAGFTTQPGLLLDAVPPGPARDALRRALRRRQAVRALHGASRLVLDTPEGRIELRDGRVVLRDDDNGDSVSDRTRPSRLAFDEALVVARWMARPDTRVCVEYAAGVCASELPRIPA